MIQTLPSLAFSRPRPEYRRPLREGQLDQVELSSEPQEPTAPIPPARRRGWLKAAVIVALAGTLGLAALGAAPSSPPAAPPAPAQVEAQTFTPAVPSESFQIEAYGRMGAFSAQLGPQIPSYLHHLYPGFYPDQALITLMYYFSQPTSEGPLAVPAGNNYFALPERVGFSSNQWNGPVQDGLRVYSSAMESVMDFDAVLRSGSFDQVQRLGQAETAPEFFQALAEVGFLTPSQQSDVQSLYHANWEGTP